MKMENRLEEFNLILSETATYDLKNQHVVVIASDFLRGAYVLAEHIMLHLNAAMVRITSKFDHLEELFDKIEGIDCIVFLREFKPLERADIILPLRERNKKLQYFELY